MAEGMQQIRKANAYKPTPGIESVPEKTTMIFKCCMAYPVPYNRFIYPPTWKTCHLPTFSISPFGPRVNCKGSIEIFLKVFTVVKGHDSTCWCRLLELETVGCWSWRKKAFNVVGFCSCLWLDSLNHRKHREKNILCPWWFLTPTHHMQYISILICFSPITLPASSSIMCNAIMQHSAAKSTNRPTKKVIPSSCVTFLAVSPGLLWPCAQHPPLGLRRGGNMMSLTSP